VWSRKEKEGGRKRSTQKGERDKRKNEGEEGKGGRRRERPVTEKKDTEK